MKLLDIIILSHERPDYLEELLESLKPLSKFKDTIDIKVVDNSLHAKQKIQFIVNKAGAVVTVFKQEPGVSQKGNYMNALDIARAEYLMLIHDDDVVMVNCANKLIDSLRRFKGDLGYLKSINMPRDQGGRSTSFCDDSYICQDAIYLRLWPHKLPAFPAWIYRNSKSLNIFSAMLGSEMYGKYSDIPIIYALAAKAKRIELMPGMVYCCRNHQGQDSEVVHKRQFSNVLRDYGKLGRVRIFFILLRIRLAKIVKYSILRMPFCTRS